MSGHGYRHEPAGPKSNGARPDRSHSRFFCNAARKLSLFFLAVAFAALVIGGGFAEISKSGSPTTAETAVVRWIIVASLILFVVSYLAGGRMRRVPPSGLGPGTDDTEAGTGR